MARRSCFLHEAAKGTSKMTAIEYLDILIDDTEQQITMREELVVECREKEQGDIAQQHLLLASLQAKHLMNLRRLKHLLTK